LKDGCLRQISAMRGGGLGNSITHRIMHVHKFNQ
jgi:hypothetical protein